MIVSEQAKRVAKQIEYAKAQESGSSTQPEESKPFLRKGASWDYAIKCGMTPDQAEAFLKKREASRRK